MTLFNLVSGLIRRAGLVFLCSAMAPAVVNAGVNSKTGGFYISFRDLQSTSFDQPRLEINRVYNSFSSFATGWLGHGWGTLFETRVSVLPEGTVAVTEYGSGFVAYYRAADPVSDSDLLDAAVKRLAAESKRHGDEADEVALRQRLRASEELRYRVSQRLKMKTHVSQGTRLSGDQCVEATLLRTSSGYQRVNCNRSVDTFDEAGRLVERKHVSGTKLKAHYAQGQDRPASLSDAGGNVITLTWDAEGLMTSATLDGKSVRYSYSALKNLIKVSSFTGSWEDFEYDENHNLTAIRYIDGTSQQLKYDEQERVVEDLGRVGEKTTYTYVVGSQHPDTRVTRITHADHTGDVSVKEVTFHIESTDTGTAQTTFVGQSINGADIGSRSMDEKGRLINKIDSEGSQTNVIYHPRTGKPIIAVRGNDAAMYYYNDAGDVALVRDASGREVELAYDRKGRINRLRDKSGNEKVRVYSLGYNSRGQLSTIDLQGQGKVVVTYDSNGEISQVHSKSGAAVGLAISQTFFQLLSMVKLGQ